MLGFDLYIGMSVINVWTRVVDKPARYAVSRPTWGVYLNVFIWGGYCTACVHTQIAWCNLLSVSSALWSHAVANHVHVSSG